MFLYIDFSKNVNPIIMNLNRHARCEGYSDRHGDFIPEKRDPNGNKYIEKCMSQFCF